MHDCFHGWLTPCIYPRWFALSRRTGSYSPPPSVPWKPRKNSLSLWEELDRSQFLFYFYPQEKDSHSKQARLRRMKTFLILYTALFALMVIFNHCVKDLLNFSFQSSPKWAGNHLGLALEAVLPCTKTDGLSVTVDMEVKKLVNQNSQNNFQKIENVQN